MYVVKALADCWRDCPKPALVPAVVHSGMDMFRKKDAEFLHSLGVKFPDEAESEVPRRR